MRLQQLGDPSVLLNFCRMSRYDAFTSWSTCTLRMQACRPLFPALEPSHVQAVTMLLLVQAGAKPTAAQKRTLDLEAPAQALGPAEKRRILENSSALSAAAASVAPEPAVASHAAQNEVGAPQIHPAAPAATEAAAGVPEQAGSAPAAPSVSASMSHADMDAAGKAQPTHGSMSNADSSGAKGVGAADQQHQGSAIANSMSDKQKQQNGPAGQTAQQAAQNSREATPELKLDQLDVKTDQVRWQPHTERLKPCSFILFPFTAWTLTAFTLKPATPCLASCTCNHAHGAGWQASKRHSCARIQSGEG